MNLYVLRDIRMLILCQNHIKSRLVDTVHKLMTFCANLAAFWPKFLLDGFVLEPWLCVGQVNMCLVRDGTVVIMCKTLVVLWVRIHSCYFKNEAFHSKETVDGADEVESTAWDDDGAELWMAAVILHVVDDKRGFERHREGWS